MATLITCVDAAVYCACVLNARGGECTSVPSLELCGFFLIL